MSLHTVPCLFSRYASSWNAWLLFYLWFMNETIYARFSLSFLILHWLACTTVCHARVSKVHENLKHEPNMPCWNSKKWPSPYCCRTCEQALPGALTHPVPPPPPLRVVARKLLCCILFVFIFLCFSSKPRRLLCWLLSPLALGSISAARSSPDFVQSLSLSFGEERGLISRTEPTLAWDPSDLYGPRCF